MEDVGFGIIREMGLGICDEGYGIWFFGSDSRKTLVSEQSESLRAREFGARSAPDILFHICFFLVVGNLLGIVTLETLGMIWHSMT